MLRGILIFGLGVLATRLYFNPLLQGSAKYMKQEKELKRLLGLKTKNVKKNIKMFIGINYPEATHQQINDATNDILTF